jgi:hypothetical protein
VLSNIVLPIAYNSVFIIAPPSKNDIPEINKLEETDILFAIFKLDFINVSFKIVLPSTVNSDFIVLFASKIVLP